MSSLNLQLFNACNAYDDAAVAALLDQGADINALDNQGNTHLFRLIDADEHAISTIALLISRKADVTIENGDGVSPLARAVAIGDVTIVRMLVEAGANPHKDAYIDGDNGVCSLLFEAIYYPDVMEYLVGLGLDKEAMAPDGDTPLLSAIAESQDESAIFLINAGAQLDVRDDVDRTPLMLAMYLDYDYGADVIDSLLAAKADINAKGMNHAWTALHLAAYVRTEAIPHLVHAGADIESRTSEGMTPLMLAARDSHLDRTQALLDEGADPLACDNIGNTTMMFFDASPNAPEVLELLRNKGADPHARNLAGQTALHVAAETGAPLVIEYLLNLGVDHKIRDNEGQTALDVAEDPKCRALLEYWQLKPGKQGEPQSITRRKRL